MADAVYVRAWDLQQITAAASVGIGELWQLADGSAAYFERLAGTTSNPVIPGSSGDRVQFRTRDKVTIPKTTSLVILDGGRVYWDHSANAAHYKKVNDRDFYVGRAVGDAASADAFIVVDLNADPAYDIDVARDCRSASPRRYCGVYRCRARAGCVLRAQARCAARRAAGIAARLW